MATRAHRGRLAFALATGAVVWAAGFTVWALTASVYSDGQTILEANPETNRGWARTSGIVAASFLVFFAVVTGFTIGLFVLPGAVALMVAAVHTPVGPQ